MMRHILARTAVSLTLFHLIGSIELQAADERTEPRSISVSGRGKVSAAPNVADISVGVVSRAATAREALSSNNERMAGLQQLVKERGIPAKDIQTSQFAVQPQYSQPPPYHPGQQPENYVTKLVGYQVQNSVRITVRDLTKLGLLLDAVVADGANQVYGVNLRTDDESLMDEARRRAMADAKRKAEILAGEAGMVVGLPVSIREEAYAYPVPAPAAPPGIGYAMAAPSASAPIAPGEQQTILTIYVVYELNSAK
jgi:uncharacterized protein